MTLLIFKRVFFIVLGLAIISQVPFAVGRFRTARLADQIDRQAALRKPAGESGFRDYKGVVHVHSFLGGHSTGTFEELISAADANGLDFVVMTEHVSESFDTSSKTLTGKHGKALWIGGNEVSTADGDRFLILDGFEGLSRLSGGSTADLLNEVRKRGKTAIIAYPGKYRSWDEEADGVEVLSLNTSARKFSPMPFLFDAVWSYGAYPELTLARYIERPSDDLRRYDAAAGKRKQALFGGNDAHSNLGIHVGDDANNRWIDLKYDRYSSVFRLLRTHVLLPDDRPFERQSLLDALKNGHSYISMDVLGDPTGFAYFARTAAGNVSMGDEASPARAGVEGPELVVASPLEARIVILRDGAVEYESEAVHRIEYRPKATGAYRVEVYLDSLGSPFDKVPWIISNPVYLW